MSNLPNKGSGEAFFFEETTFGTLPTSSAYQAVAMAGITFAVQEQKEVVAEANRPVPTAIKHHSAHISGQLTLQFRFGRDCSDLLALSIRDTILPAEANVTTAAECSFLSSETHLDGETSAQQIKDVGSTGAFDTLLTASSQSDLRQALLLITDAATAGNNSATRGPILVKTGNPRDSGADTLLDLNTRLFQTADAGPSTSWGSDWAANDTLDAINLDAGAYLGLHLARPAGNDTISCIMRLADIATPQYFSVSGMALGPPTLVFNGRGSISWQIPYTATVWTDQAVAVPGSGNTLVDSVNTYKPIIGGGAEITKIFLATDSATLALEGTEITDLTWTAGGSAPTVVHDTHGTDAAAGYFHTRHLPSFGFNAQIANAASPRIVTLQGWANAHTPLTGILEFTDSAGNVMYMKADQTKPASMIVQEVGGADGPARVAFMADVYELTRDDLAWTVHFFAAS